MILYVNVWQILWSKLRSIVNHAKHNIPNPRQAMQTERGFRRFWNGILINPVPLQAVQMSSNTYDSV